MGRSEDALPQMMDAIKAAQGRGAAVDNLDETRKLHRRAQWRVYFCNAENSLGFHAPQEVARILGEAIDFPRQGHISALQK